MAWATRTIALCDNADCDRGPDKTPSSREVEAKDVTPSDWWSLLPPGDGQRLIFCSTDCVFNHLGDAFNHLEDTPRSVKKS